MKKTLAVLTALTLTLSSFASAPIADAILKQFSAAFPTVQNAKWFEAKDHYDVYFEKEGVKHQIQYNLKGKIVSTRNYYEGDKLCAFLKAKLSEKYPTKTVYGVTEITNSDEMFYTITLEDKKRWTTLRMSPIGQISEVEELNKAPQ